MTALFGAKYAWEQDIPANVHFLWELEEEIGSPHFETTIKANVKDFATDSVVVSDTVWVSRARPAQPAGLRGLQGFRFTLQTGETDQHSGTAGGAARNPVTEICQVIAECVDGRTGRVKIPGFYADVVPPSKRELEDLKNCGFTTKDFKRDHMFRSLRVDDPLEIMKRVWMMPTFEVHGIAGGYQGPGVKTIIPPKATAIVSCRLVPNMNPKKIVRLVTEFVKGKNPDVKVSAEHELPAYQGQTTGPYADAIRGAMKFASAGARLRPGGRLDRRGALDGEVLKAPCTSSGFPCPSTATTRRRELRLGQARRDGAFADYFRRVADLGKPTPEYGGSDPPFRRNPATELGLRRLVEPDQAAEEPAPLRLALDEELLELAAVEEDPLAGGALLDLDVRDGLDVHVAAALGTLPPVRLAAFLGLAGLFRFLRELTFLPRRLDHRGFVLPEPVVLAPLADVLGIENHGGIVAAYRLPQEILERDPIPRLRVAILPITGSGGRVPTPSPFRRGSPGRRARRPLPPGSRAAGRVAAGIPLRARRRRPASLP